MFSMNFIVSYNKPNRIDLWISSFEYRIISVEFTFLFICLWICALEGLHMPWCVCRSQRTYCASQLPPSIMSYPGIILKYLCLVSTFPCWLISMPHHFTYFHENYEEFIWITFSCYGLVIYLVQVSFWILPH